MAELNSYFISALAPKAGAKVTRETEVSNNNGAGNIPQSQIGIPVPAVIGRKRVPDANTIWTGNLRPLTETTNVSSETTEIVGGENLKTTTTVTTTTIVGYLIDIHMGICLGPGVKLKAVYINNSPIWQGDIGPARTEFTIDENETFLSKADCVFSGGAFDQAPEPDIAVPDYPGYVGIATILLKNVRADLPMNNLSFEVTRAPNPLGLSAGNNLDGDDVNVASAIVEVMTNEWGYGGLSIDDIDTVNFSSVAATLKTEANFCSMKIGDDAQVSSIMKALQDQASMIIFQKPSNGLITASLFRTTNIDYISADKKFNKNNIIELRSYTKSWWKDTADQARGSYTERDADYNEVPVFVSNNSNPSSTGRGKKTVNIYYPYVATRELALALTARDLAPISVPLANFSLLTNRDGATKQPGDIILVTWPKYGLLNAPMLVLSVRKQELSQNNVVLSLTSMSLPDITPSYGLGGSVFNPDFSIDPVTPSAVAFLTAPYFFARSAFALSSTQLTPFVYPVVLPTPANNNQYSFSALVQNVPNAGGDTEKIRNGIYPTVAKLTNAIGLYDGFDIGKISSIDIYSTINPVNLYDIDEVGVIGGRLFIIIDNEILSFESVTNNGGGSYTLHDVHRALLDTTFAAHGANTTIYVVSNNFNYVAGGFSYPPGYSPSWLITPNSLLKNGVASDGLVTTAWAPVANRTLSPPRPHNTKVNGTARSSTPVSVVEGASVTVTWSTRSRTNTKVALMLDAAETPESTGSGQKHRVYHRSSGGVYTDIGGLEYSGNTATFTMPDVANGIGSIVVISHITLGGILYTSLYEDRIPVSVS